MQDHLTECARCGRPTIERRCRYVDCAPYHETHRLTWRDAVFLVLLAVLVTTC